MALVATGGEHRPDLFFKEGDFVGVRSRFRLNGLGRVCGGQQGYEKGDNTDPPHHSTTPGYGFHTSEALTRGG
jgi:hypothetical protein